MSGGPSKWAAKYSRIAEVRAQELSELCFKLHVMKRIMLCEERKDEALKEKKIFPRLM